MIRTPPEAPKDILLWHDREKWVRFTAFLNQCFTRHGEELCEAVEHAHTLSSLMAEVSPFIQQNTAAVCPACEKFCCVNRHGYYDHRDLIYIFALGLRHPDYREGLEDAGPCQFMSGSGCTLERSVRPFRCNWYFCAALLAHMENGPARPYREFVDRFREIVDIRSKMLEAFAARTGSLACQEKDLFSL